MGTGQCFRHVDSWTTRATAHADMGQLWTGTTRFLVRTADDTTTTTTANTTTTAKERRGSELGLALRGGGRLLGFGVALRCSGSRPEAGGHGLGYQRETRKRSRSPVGWASLVSHSSTLVVDLDLDEKRSVIDLSRKAVALFVTSDEPEEYSDALSEWEGSDDGKDSDVDIILEWESSDAEEDDDFHGPAMDLCGFVVESILLNSAETSSSGRPFDITVDSGAGKSVMPPDAAPDYELQTSAGQLEGQHFVGAGGDSSCRPSSRLRRKRRHGHRSDGA